MIVVSTKFSNTNFTKLVVGCTEAVAQIAILGPQGVSNAISAMFRVFDSTHEKVDISIKARILVNEIVMYSYVKILIEFDVRDRDEEIKKLLNDIMDDFDLYFNNKEATLSMESLLNPRNSDVFKYFSDKIGHILRPFLINYDLKNEELSERFIITIASSVSRITSRSWSYYKDLLDALDGATRVSNRLEESWMAYRQKLIKDFESGALFGEDDEAGVKISQVYQPLRCTWFEYFPEEDEKLHDQYVHNIQANKKPKIHVEDIEGFISEWVLRESDGSVIKLISGGPGSGKSTFARKLASNLSYDLTVRTVFLPLQRLGLEGSLLERVDKYLRLEGDVPFERSMEPVSQSLGMDGFEKWLFIFDGLDEIAKEGQNSEKAASDFASSLNEWRAQIGHSVDAKFIVLGRAPSMQDARRRLALIGNNVLHVCDMLPLDDDLKRRASEIIDLKNLGTTDQRPLFWKKWAVAKNLSLDTPLGLMAEELSDLTKEPLLAYLLIMSDKIGENYKEAAKNKNSIYESIFDKIWRRESEKLARNNLKQIGKDGYLFLLMSLGLAAWRGGGRTGDEVTFEKVRDIVLPPKLLREAKECGASELSNIALLFYTRKDEDGGGGYEFLHKSFGEYLTAIGLFNCFDRWLRQVTNPDGDFSEENFLDRWAKLCGGSSITHEIFLFLKNEVERSFLKEKDFKPWIKAKKTIEEFIPVLDRALLIGTPNFKSASSWTEADAQYYKTLGALFSILSAFVSIAYPKNALLDKGNPAFWKPGAVRIPAFQENPKILSKVLYRIRDVNVRIGFTRYEDDRHSDIIVFFQGTNVSQEFFAAFDLSQCELSGENLVGMRLYGCKFSQTALFGTDFSHSDLTGAYFSRMDMLGTVFVSADLKRAFFSNIDATYTKFYRSDLRDSEFKNVNFAFVDFQYVKHGNIKFKKIHHTNIRVSDKRFTNKIKLA